MKIAGSASTDDDTLGGGEIPPCTRLTPDALPEVQKPVWADNSHTGDTSDFVPKQNHHWFVFRVLYGHTQDVIEAFKHAEILHYTPSVYQKVEISGKKMLRKEPLLPGLVFAYITRTRTLEFVKLPAMAASYLKD